MAWIHNGLLGRIASMQEIKQTNSGSKILTFVVASEYGFGDNKGTDFVTCNAWNKTAEFVEKYFKKGDPILLEGDFHNKPFRKYTGSNGREYDVPNWIVTVQNIVFLPQKKQTQEEVMKDAGYQPVGTPVTAPQPPVQQVSQQSFVGGYRAVQQDNTNNGFEVLSGDNDLPF